jgi:hypothetical protein
MIRPLGVPLSRGGQYFERFMGGSLKSEIGYLTTFFDREGGNSQEATHPDAIKGK